MSYIILILAMGLSALVGPAIVDYYGPLGWLLLIPNALGLGFAANYVSDRLDL